MAKSSKRTSKDFNSETSGGQVENTKGSRDPYVTSESQLSRMLRHYLWGVQDMDTRRVRKNGWNDVINAYMAKIPVNWPYNSVVTNPVIRTTILEKTSRLLNAKLQGRMIPREGADIIKAKIVNALLDFQWDNAVEGGSMIEKVARADQYARIFGASWAFVFWDEKRLTNEIKIIDPRDVFIDGAASHIRNAKWAQIREFTTFDKLEQRGYDVAEARSMAFKGEITAELRSSRYESITKANRGLVDRTGMIDDLKNPVVEVCTEWGWRVGDGRELHSYEAVFLPKYGTILEDRKNPYKHGKIPLGMLRYYPLDDDIYGDSEVEYVLPLYRAMNSMICGLIDECNIKIRPPLKISATGVRIETIEYGPGAKWIMNNPSAVQELEPNGGFATAFNTVYPMLLAAYNTAMGDNSLGVSNLPPFNEQKTATEIVTQEKQSNNRDQYNQLYLAEFLKDIMLMWHSNNKQYLFDDPTKKYYVLKIIGKDNLQTFQQIKLDAGEPPDWAVKRVGEVIAKNPTKVSPQMIDDILSDVTVPKHPVILNPDEKNPDKIQVKAKMEVKNAEEADIYLTPSDFEGIFDYIPDVKSMAIGAGIMQTQARQKVYETLFNNPIVLQTLQAQGFTIKAKEVLVDMFEDAGSKDAESVFEPIQNQQMQGGLQNGSQNTGGGPGAAPSSGALIPNGGGGMAGVPQAIPSGLGNIGIPGPQRLPVQ